MRSLQRVLAVSGVLAGLLIPDLLIPGPFMPSVIVCLSSNFIQRERRLDNANTGPKTHKRANLQNQIRPLSPVGTSKTATIPFSEALSCRYSHYRPTSTLSNIDFRADSPCPIDLTNGNRAPLANGQNGAVPAAVVLVTVSVCATFVAEPAGCLSILAAFVIGARTWKKSKP